jgi:hypothetical protein
LAHHNQLGLSEPLKLILGITNCASLASLAIFRHNLGRVYSTVGKWRIFYVLTLENILRILGGEYFTRLRWGIFYVPRVEYILRLIGRVYSTVAMWRIKYGAGVENILRIAGREYSTTHG